MLERVQLSFQINNYFLIQKLSGVKSLYLAHCSLLPLYLNGSTVNYDKDNDDLENYSHTDSCSDLQQDISVSWTLFSSG